MEKFQLTGKPLCFFDGVIFNHKDSIEPVTAQDGLRVMQIIEAAIQSSEQKRLIDL
jgi:predicted dehydrogenase